jgi:hypothetical protein
LFDTCAYSADRRDADGRTAPFTICTRLPCSGESSTIALPVAGDLTNEGSPHVTPRRPSGPRRSRSVSSYQRLNRLFAVVALAALTAGVVSDARSGAFWIRHTLLASIVASVLVVMVSVAVVNEVLARRGRRRWRILAQYVMFELVRNARMIWLGVLEVAGLVAAGPNDQESIDSAAEKVRDTSRLTAALREVLSDDERRGRLHTEIAFLTDHADQVLGRWAGVMLNAAVYADVIDRHVELAGDVAWLASVLDTSNPPDDTRRVKRARSNPAVQIESHRDVDWLADRVVVISQLAATLDRGTVELALRIVPVSWWQERLGTTTSRPQG